MSAGWEPHPRKITQGTMVACFPFQHIKQVIDLSLLGWMPHIRHMARSARENNPKYILYINTQQIRDPWDLQKQSTFQCILITTHWSRFKNWTHKPTPRDLTRIWRQPFCVFWRISVLSNRWDGWWLVIIKEGKHVEALDCIKAAHCESMHNDDWKVMNKVGIGWANPWKITTLLV